MIAPAVSAAFESGCVTDVTGITSDGVYTAFSYNGNVLNDMKMGENLPHHIYFFSANFQIKMSLIFSQRHFHICELFPLHLCVILSCKHRVRI